MKLKMRFYLLLLSAFGATAARYSSAPKFNDSAIIIDADESLLPKTATLPYYQPVQNHPSYKIVDNKNISRDVFNTKASSASIFTQEEFPRDLLEIAQHKLGLKTMDEVPSISELAELLGTNSAPETISYIRQLTSTDQGIALMKAYIESSDYTDSGRSEDIKSSTTKAPKTTTVPNQNITQTGFFSRMPAWLNFYGRKPQPKQVMDQQLKNSTSNTQLKPNVLKNMRPFYVRNPLPYHYPIPIRPLNVNRTALGKNYGRQFMVRQGVHNHSRLNTSKALNPSYIQQLARIANVSPKKLETVLQQKPKLAELAVKIVSFPQGKVRNPLADTQLLAAVRKVMEQDEDLKKLLAANTLL